MFLRYICVVTCSCSFISLWYNILMLMSHNLLVHYSVDGKLGCIQFFTFIKRIFLYKCTRVFLENMYFLENISAVEMLVCRVYNTHVYKITPTCLPNASVSFHSHHQCIRFLFVRAHFSTIWNYQTLFASFMGFSIYIPLIINEVKHIFMFISHMIAFLKNVCLYVFYTFLQIGSFVLLMSADYVFWILISYQLYMLLISGVVFSFMVF